MANLNGFDANTVEPSVGFDPIPDGKYIAAITESEMKRTKNGLGQYLKLTFTIIDGGSPAGSKYKGRKLWVQLNLDNPSSTAVQIARSELSAICRAVGVMQPQDSTQLHNLPLSIKVICKNRKDTGEITNEIKGYEKKEAALAPSAPVAPANQQAPPSIQTQTAGPAPWTPQETS